MACCSLQGTAIPDPKRKRNFQVGRQTKPVARTSYHLPLALDQTVDFDFPRPAPTWKVCSVSACTRTIDLARRKHHQ